MIKRKFQKLKGQSTQVATSIFSIRRTPNTSIKTSVKKKVK